MNLALELDELDLDLPALPPRKGRPAEPITAEVERELTSQDLSLRSTEVATNDQPTIKKINDRHRLLARLCARGVMAKQAAAIAGYSVCRVTTLKSDPTFRELVNYYRSEVDEDFNNLSDELSSLLREASTELRFRLEDAPEKLTNAQLTEIIQLAADRTGHGPQSSTTNMNIQVGIADRMRAGRERAERNKMIDAVAVETTDDTA